MTLDPWALQNAYGMSNPTSSNFWFRNQEMGQWQQVQLPAPDPTPTPVPGPESALKWLNRRVQEMRVKL